MNLEKLMVAGGGVLGSQIAFQSAYAGMDVTIWLRSEESIQRTKMKIGQLTEEYQQFCVACKNGMQNYLGGFDKPDVTVENGNYEMYQSKIGSVMERIHFETDLTKAAAGQDFIIEAVTENMELKKDFYRKLNQVIDEKVVVATNTSTFLPSDFKDCISNSQRFIAVHFSNHIWLANIAEIMGHSETSAETVKTAVAFAQRINMIPSVIHKETRGYILNSLLIPFLISALKLWGGGIADFRAIDNTWKLSTASPYGAFEIMDIIGLPTAYAMTVGCMDSSLVSQEGTLEYTIAEKLKNMIAKNENFYKS